MILSVPDFSSLARDPRIPLSPTRMVDVAQTEPTRNGFFRQRTHTQYFDRTVSLELRDPTSESHTCRDSLDQLCLHALTFVPTTPGT